MKIRYLLAIVGLAIGFALPTFAQGQNTVDPEARQQIETLFMKFGEAFNKRDPVAMAALFSRTRFSYGRGRRKTLWLPASKPSRKGLQSCYRVPANSSVRWLRSIPSATTCPSSPKGVWGLYGRVIEHGSACTTLILGRFEWNTLIDR